MANKRKNAAARAEAASSAQDYPTTSAPAEDVDRDKKFEQETRLRPQPAETSPGMAILMMLREVFFYVFDVLIMAIGNVKKPLSYLVGFWVLLVALDVGRKSLFHLAGTALSPICVIPGVSQLIPFCPDTTWDMPSLCDYPLLRWAAPSQCPKRTGQGPNFKVEELMDVQDQLGQILEKKVDSVSLPYDMTKSNSAMMDLKDLIVWSTLPSKEDIGRELEDYITLTEQVVDELNDFNLHCSALVDNVIILNRFTLHTIERIAAKEEMRQDSLTLRMASWVSSVLFADDTTEEKILDTYIQHMSSALEYIEATIEEAALLNMKLTKGRGHLDRVKRLSTRVSDSIEADREDFLEYLWNVVKRIAPPSRNLSKQLPLLHKVNNQREVAAANIQVLSQELSVVRGSLKELKTRMATPGMSMGLSLRVHVATISNAAEKLESVRIRTSAEEEERREKAREAFGMKKHGMFIEPE